MGLLTIHHTRPPRSFGTGLQARKDHHMPTEAYILRRTFPVPITNADNARANDIMAMAGDHPMDAAAWHTAIKEATGALDEVYAVIDGREVRVATISADTITTRDGTNIDRALESLLIAADEAGYWSRPHEVRIDLEEPQMSHKTMARIAGNSFIVAGSK